MSTDSRNPLLTPREREAAEQRLQDAVEQGVIELDEFEDRIGVVLTARTRDDLLPAVADLPAPPDEPPRKVTAVVADERLDLRPVLGRRQVVDVTATAVLGDVTILVPPGTEVELSGFSVLGDRSVKVVRPPNASQGPVLHLEANALLGDVTVRSLEHGAQDRRRRWPGMLAAAAVAVGALGVGSAVAAADLDAVSVFGSTVHRVAAGDDEVTTLSVFGSTEIVVPPDARVEPNGLAVFGRTDCAACERPAPPSGEVVVVRSLSLFGSTQILAEGQETEDD